MSVDDGALPDTDALYDRAPCALIVTSKTGLILRANATFCDWLGYTKEQLIGQRKLQELLTVGGRIFHQTHWMPLLEMQRSIAEVKLEFKRADGTRLPMMLNATRREHAGAMLDDVSAFVLIDRHRFEQEVLISKRQAEQALQAQLLLQEEVNLQQAAAEDRARFAEQMVGIVSHDLRNPLSVILMAAQMLERQELAPRQQVLVRHAKDATHRAQRLINDLLDFTQAHVGQGIAISRKRIDLHAVVAHSLGELQLVYADRTITQVASGQGDCFADGDRLAQLIGNLLSNAITYGDANKAVTVTSTHSEQSIELTVHNWGKPIAQDFLPTLFSPMTRGVDLSNGARSVGLGLFIVSEIAKAHGGFVSVSSTAEHGTTFKAVLANSQ